MLPAPSVRSMVSSKGWVMPGDAGRAPEQRVHRPAERREGAERDQGVHGGGAVAQVDPRGAVERPGAPDDDRRGEGERQPLPVGRTGAREPSPSRPPGTVRTDGDEQPLPQRRAGRRQPQASSTAVVGTRQSGAVPGLLDGADQVAGVTAVGVGDLGLLGGVVDGGDHAVELVELALDPVGARGAGHPADLELDVVAAVVIASARAFPAVRELPVRPVKPRCGPLRRA